MAVCEYFNAVFCLKKKCFVGRRTPPNEEMEELQGERMTDLSPFAFPCSISPLSLPSPPPLSTLPHASSFVVNFSFFLSILRLVSPLPSSPFLPLFSPPFPRPLPVYSWISVSTCLRQLVLLAPVTDRQTAFLGCGLSGVSVLCCDWCELITCLARE